MIEANEWQAPVEEFKRTITYVLDGVTIKTTFTSDQPITNEEVIRRLGHDPFVMVEPIEPIPWFDPFVMVEPIEPIPWFEQIERARVANAAMMVEPPVSNSMLEGYILGLEPIIGPYYSNCLLTLDKRLSCINHKIGSPRKGDRKLGSGGSVGTDFAPLFDSDGCRVGLLRLNWYDHPHGMKLFVSWSQGGCDDTVR